MKRFDTVVMMDWSARSKPSPKRPSKDAIWIGIARDGALATAEYHRTRAGAMTTLTDLLVTEADAERRVLCGFDFAFGYPAGVAERLCGKANALALWEWFAEAVTDDARNVSNRFEVAERINAPYEGVGPCWGRPASWNYPDVPTRKTARTGNDHPNEKRLIEIRIPKAKSVWQLAYAGSVGSQVIVGLPRLTALRRERRLDGRIAVWPFDSGANVPDAPVVIVEIYPSMIDAAVAAGRQEGEIIDRAQVRILADHFARLDRRGELVRLFEGGNSLTERERGAILGEEGWIFGIPLDAKPNARP